MKPTIPTKPATPTKPPIWPAAAWLTAFLISVAGPLTAVIIMARAELSAPPLGAVAAVLVLGMMGVAMIASAVTGRLWIGALLAGVNAVCLTLTCMAFDLLAHSISALFVVTVLAASISFAARGSLFALSASPGGWLVAFGVVAGEAAIVLTALFEPGVLPDWLLALLPAQWASIALQSAFFEGATAQALASIVALLGTAAATMFVTYMWPRRWTYGIMFTTWLALSAVVWSAGTVG